MQPPDGISDDLGEPPSVAAVESVGGAMFPLSVAFELGLGIVALGLGWCLGHDPRATLRWVASEAGWGAVAAIPPLVFALSTLQWMPRLMPEVCRIVDELLVPLFRECTVWQLAMLSLAAGFGEELLFRGLVQGGASQWLGPWGGLAVASVLFGMAHALNREYFFLTTGMGIYLGGLWMFSDSLLLVVVTHAVYDFLVLVLMVRIRRGRVLQSSANG